MENNSEALLIELAQKGDLEAFNTLARHYQNLLYRISLRILNDEFLAEDALQNALIQAFGNFRSFRGGSLRSWLARVAVNASYDELRRGRRHISLPLEQFTNDGDEIESPDWMRDQAAGPEERAETSELRSALYQCIRALAPDYRLMVILVDVEGLSYEETARIARVPVGTVKSRLARARMQIRSKLRAFQGLLPAAYQVDLRTSVAA